MNRAVLSQKKKVIYGDIRKNSDGIINLKKEGRCPGVIRTISGNPEDEIDVVLNGKDIRKLMKSKGYKTDMVHLRVEGK